ncbi:MAG: FAD-dependent oxidoreductase [Nitrospirae bacterium]|nr:FAD-dependent oxidoreductase [Nitrospirota bacterium]
MTPHPRITILGGGAAGLAVGYYSKKKKVPFTIHEAGGRIGGNCVTFTEGDFRFDSGAHRFHDKDDEITEEFRQLLGDGFRKIKVPSYIYHNGKLVFFPLAPLNMFKNLGPFTFFKVAVEILASRIAPEKDKGSFKDFAVNTYGKTLARSFLLNYSEKLWGRDCGELSPQIAGKRMKGLDLRTFVVEAFMGQRAKTEHVDGSFYYPDLGIGAITDKLAEYCGEENIRRRSEITRIICGDNKIECVEINGEEIVEVDKLVSTLPLYNFLRMMDPQPEEGILEIAKKLRYRNVVLVAFFLAKESLTDAGTIYFPDSDTPITRMYEPRNRSIRMSPAGRTSLVVEIPCAPDELLWHSSDEKLVETAYSNLADIGILKAGDIISTSVKRLSHAYPVLETGFEAKVQEVNGYLKRFENLRLSGRSGKFEYAWIHGMMRSGREIVDEHGLA